MPDLTELITTAQVAERLGKTPRTVQRMVASGALVPAATFPGKTGANLFDPSDIDRLLQTEPAA